MATAVALRMVRPRAAPPVARPACWRRRHSQSTVSDVFASPCESAADAKYARQPHNATTRRQLKAAKKANRLRPKKKMPSDINRKPPPYDVEPQYYEGRPDEYVVESEGSDDFDKNAHIAKVLADLEAQADYDNTDAAEEEKIMASVKYPDPAAAFVAMAK